MVSFIAKGKIFSSCHYHSRSKNDRPITKDDRVKFDVTGDTVKLTITEVVQTDAGTYELVAENPLGSIDCTAKLTVHCMSNRFFIAIHSTDFTFSTTYHCHINTLANQCSSGSSLIYFM